MSADDPTPVPNWARSGALRNLMRSENVAALALARRADNLGQAKRFARILAESRDCAPCGASRRLGNQFEHRYEQRGDRPPTGLCPQHRLEWDAVDAFDTPLADLTDAERAELDDIRRRRAQERFDEIRARRDRHRTALDGDRGGGV